MKIVLIIYETIRRSNESKLLYTFLYDYRIYFFKSTSRAILLQTVVHQVSWVRFIIKGEASSFIYHTLIFYIMHKTGPW